MGVPLQLEKQQNDYFVNLSEFLIPFELFSMIMCYTPRFPNYFHFRRVSKDWNKSIVEFCKQLTQINLIELYFTGKRRFHPQVIVPSNNLINATAGYLALCPNATVLIFFCPRQTNELVGLLVDDFLASYAETPICYQSNLSRFEIYYYPNSQYVPTLCFRLVTTTRKSLLESQLQSVKLYGGTILPNFKEAQPT